MVRSPFGSMIRAGTPAARHSSTRTIPSPVLPDPVMPTMTPCVVRSAVAMAVRSPVRSLVVGSSAPPMLRSAMPATYRGDDGPRCLRWDPGGTMNGTRMSAQDALWLTMDRPNNLMVIDVAVVLDGVPSVDAAPGDLRRPRLAAPGVRPEGGAPRHVVVVGRRPRPRRLPARDRGAHAARCRDARTSNGTSRPAGRSPSTAIIRCGRRSCSRPCGSTTGRPVRSSSPGSITRSPTACASPR